MYRIDLKKNISGLQLKEKREMIPTAWGPLFWKLLHFNYSTADQAAAELTDSKQSYIISDLHQLLIDQLDIVQWLLPCRMCRKHFTQFLLQHDPQPILQSLSEPSQRDNKEPGPAAVLMFSMHNWVNKDLGKPLWTKAQLKRSLPYSPPTAKEMDTLLKCILSDDICNPSSDQAQIQRQMYAYQQWSQFPVGQAGQFIVEEDNPHTCIAPFQVQRFIGNLQSLYSLYAQILPKYERPLKSVLTVLKQYQK